MTTSQKGQSRKVSRLLTHKTQITNVIDYNNFFKKGLASSRVLDIEYFDTNYYHNNELRDKMQQRVIKLLKTAKPIKALLLHKCIIQYENIPNSIIKQVSKKVSRVKALSLPDYALSQELIEKYSLWLKYAIGLRKFDFIAPPCVDFPDGHIRKFDSSLKKFFHEIRRDRINSLNITHNTADDVAGGSFLRFKHYPSTLKSLAFDWRHYSTDYDSSLPEVSKSLSHMKDLTSVSLAFRNQPHLLDPILSSIKKFSQITSLDIEFLDNVHQDADLPFAKLSKLKNLTNLKLKFDFWPKGFETFLNILEHCPLTDFYLDAVVGHDTHLDALSNLLGNLKDLESLTLKIYKNALFGTESTLKNLFEKVAQMKPLRNLKLHFLTSTTSKKNDLCSSLIPSLRSAFNKAIKLQNFSFHFNQIDARKAFLEIISLVNPIAPVLKKLEFDVGDYHPQDSDYIKILGLVQRLESVEVLKLDSLSVNMNTFVQDLIDVLYKLKYLKVFELRQMRGSLATPTFVEGVEKILTKKGLNKFDCTLAWDRKEMETSRRRGFQRIDLKEVLKKNPDLQSHPEAGGIFVYYDNDTEWKWDEEICS